MQKIIPFLWFDNQTEEAMKFYISVFGPKSKIVGITRYEEGMEAPGMPQLKGKVLTGIFELNGYRFMALDGGPIFKFTPAISFIVACDTIKEVDAIWGKFAHGGKALMELGEYPFSKRYGWISDKFGLSWQVILRDEHYQYRHKITPTLLFVGDVVGRAEEAMKFYTSLFPESKLGDIARYTTGMEPDKEGTVMHGSFTLAGQEFFAMDSAQEHRFSFNEAISLLVECEDQKEIDRLWESLSAVPESEQCGWLKDKYGISWQIVPKGMQEMMKIPGEKMTKVMNEVLKMKKIVIADLERAAAEA